jgi:hypothetical protein
VIPGHEFTGTAVQLDSAAAERWDMGLAIALWRSRSCLLEVPVLPGW